MNMHEQWWLHCTSQWGQYTLLSEHVYCVDISFKMTEWVEQWICIKFFINLNVPLRKLLGWFRRPQLWETGDWQLHHNNLPTHALYLTQRFLKKIAHMTQHPYSPDLATCNFWHFSKLKLPLKGKRFQTMDEVQENTSGQLIAIGRTLWGPQVPSSKWTEASLSCVQCFSHLLE